jgi:hypothetical protein
MASIIFTELDAIPASIESLDRWVKMAYVGTHSLLIDAGLSYYFSICMDRARGKFFAVAKLTKTLWQFSIR